MDYRERGSHTRDLVHGNNEGDARGRNRHKSNARVVRNLEERSVGTKKKSPKQDLTEEEKSQTRPNQR